MVDATDYVTKDCLRTALDGAVHTIITEMGIRFGEVNQRLDRVDATLVNHGKQLAAGARALRRLASSRAASRVI